MEALELQSVPLSHTRLIEASAGTGKTYAISTLVVRLLLEGSLSIERILVVTFTEAATAELCRRVRERIKQALECLEGKAPGSDLEPIVKKLPPGEARKRLERALRDFDNASIWTIHGFCQRALRENAFASRMPFQAEFLSDTRPLVEEIVLDYWTRELAFAPRVFIEFLRQHGVSPKFLNTLANQVLTTPLLQVVPKPAADLPTVDTTAFRAAWERLRTVFDVREVSDVLLYAALNASLNKSKYPLASIPTWCQELAATLASNAELPALPKQFSHFCSETIAKAVKAPAKASKARSKSSEAATESTALPSHPAFAACDEVKREHEELCRVLAARQMAFLSAFVDFLRTELAARKRRASSLSFDDLLVGLHRTLSGKSQAGQHLAARLRERFAAALIDEFQDTDRVQYEIFTQIYQGQPNPLFLIGDPKQAIYSFRGADIFAYLKAADAASHRYTLPTNYRSDQQLVEAVNSLFLATPAPFFLPDIQFRPVQPRNDAPTALKVPKKLGAAPLQLRFIPAALTEAGGQRSDLVAREVARLLASSIEIQGRKISAKDIAILTRTNAQAFECQLALQERRIPSVVLGDQSVYLQAEAEELQFVLAAVLEPGNERALHTALVTEMLGATAAELEQLETQEKEREVWLERFRGYQQRWAHEGFVQMIRALISECEVASRLLGLVDGERRMTNLLHLVELLHVEATQRHLGPSALLRYLAEQRQTDVDSREAEQMRLESDADAVKLMTIHKSKGLEYPIVICPYLTDDAPVRRNRPRFFKYHDRTRERTVMDLDLKPEGTEWEATLDQALSENLRLLYVALTRAKHRAVVFWRQKSVEQSALAYLLYSKEAAASARESNRGQTSKHVKPLDDDAHWARLQELAKACSGIGASKINLQEPVPAYRPTSEQSGELSARTLSKRLQTWQRAASFSELSRHEGAALALASEGRDRDAVDEPVIPSATLGSRTLLADFPKGAVAGNFFHGVLERWDFTAPLDDALLVEQLERYGFPVAAAVAGQPGLAETTEAARIEAATDAGLVTLARRALTDMVETELDTGLTLKSVPSERRLNELEFFLPVAAQPTYSTLNDPLQFGSTARLGNPSQAGTPSQLSPATLARVFADHPSAELAARYAEHVRRLDFVPVEGYLRGYVDLVFQHQGRWYVVDYKTNTLGESYSDYEPAALMNAMTEGHYYLQYHLYVLALHRYLCLKQPGYQYERDFGGVYYLFLRGMHPRNGRSTGVFFEKPPWERIAALARLVSAPSDARARELMEGAA